MSEELLHLARASVRLALERGASAAEATALEGDEFEARVRLGEVETLKESGSRALGVRVLFGPQAGSSYTSDLSEAGLRRMVDSAVALARISTADPFAGLPAGEDLGSLPGDLDLFHEEIAALPAERKIAMARECEAAALGFDPRIDNSEGATFSSHTGARAFANSLGFAGAYRTASCSLSAIPVARQGEQRERDYWFSLARRLAGLETPASIGRRAASRALRRLGARKVKTAKVPVLFDSLAARSLVGHVFEALNGDAVYRKASFLAGLLDQTVAAAGLTVADDGTMPGLFGTSPFDDEGVASRRTLVLDRGRLSSYLLNSYTARKLGLRTTGNASRGVSGNASTGHGNLYLLPGEASEEDLIASVKEGLYVTELLGSGVNIVNGDYSRGAAGLWIENGRLSYPVHEVTIASNLRRMLEEAVGLADNLEFRGSVAAPAVLIREMTVSGA
jgi:PmbA protein